MKRVTILGATGSVGQNTLDLIRRAPERYKVVALTGGRNIAQLAADALEFGAELAVTAHDELLEDLRAALKGSDVEVAAGAGALVEAAERPAHWVMSAIVGVAGLPPSFAALGQGTTLALANKESLVTAGQLLKNTARQARATILPVDSEHSALFQALVGEDAAAVDRVIITASGGAFRDWPLEDLAKATLAEASAHPNWDMGQRITIDSASMFNKAMEVIEAREFFGFTPEQIEVLVHPESIVHAMVGFCDGGFMAHVGPPDMRHPIGYALNWPQRDALPLERLDLAALGQLTFREPDPARYPALRLAREVMARRGLSGAVFNAAKERCLDHFISGAIGFTHMAEVIEEVLTRVSADNSLIDAEITLDHVLHVDHLSRQCADEVVRERNG
ncbi:1-deoxy-D-xylulose-5-phosphate reductoisomerase [Roseovarius faecimaris]|uniref:1-deoxy-D-xylulose 5-phosphate reductoisomerase n=1 Tax=Roseovarius faecimaris TaxID=2494550 RepID=A0A6I6IRS3_9RHOB|nr:1-deoxy-D-xylulose-5-phosphate reductoisomerase [Roseovarius faecimaris]QGX98581.1 1-deoxy-D-xylulose-5-phosphate reductoisomerase [Roseovarius faecimaris]